MNDYRPVALTSHLMKTLERLFLSLLRPQVLHTQDPLQFAYRTVDDAILHLLHQAHTHLDKGSGTVRMVRMQVDPHQVSWITSYLTGRPQYVRLRDAVSDTVVSSTGAPQGTVLPPTLYTCTGAQSRCCAHRKQRWRV
ncbi:receptor-type tyrosine-protein phosphatase gamma-like protein [Lates japonicus]|uniref:Receptor-type tyrosine-protein phosphatase gamma-like protein n=1 Tax=Lates japonicus TaxID=270547 RepID=A0AAD3M2H8_LATJO|nr:receptor-type tyrosine-protein phosphatase gamma-like protein [Lates japonicus]